MKALGIIRLGRARRVLTLLLACVCLWMGGGVAMNHTDDLPLVRHFHAGRAAASHAVPVPAPVPCLACQWEQIAADPQTPAVPIVRLPLAFLPLPAARTAAHVPPPFAHTSPRAPPRALS